MYSSGLNKFCDSVKLALEILSAIQSNWTQKEKKNWNWLKSTTPIKLVAISLSFLISGLYEIGPRSIFVLFEILFHQLYGCWGTSHFHPIISYPLPIPKGSQPNYQSYHIYNERTACFFFIFKLAMKLMKWEEITFLQCTLKSKVISMCWPFGFHLLFMFVKWSMWGRDKQNKYLTNLEEQRKKLGVQSWY